MPPDEDWESTFSRISLSDAKDLRAVVELYCEAPPNQWRYLRMCAVDSIKDHYLYEMIFRHEYPWRFRLEQFCNAYFSRTA